MAENSDSYLHEADEWIPGQIVDIETTADTGYGPGFKWVIQLDDSEEGDFDIWAFCSQKLSQKSKLYGWLTGMGATVEIGQTYDLDQLVGMRCQIMFEQFDKDGATKEKVVKIRAEKAKTQTTGGGPIPTPLQKKQAQASAAKAPKRETTDFANPDEAPF